MKIKNVTAKVIGVLGRDLMPDESMTCNENIVNNMAVATMMKMGFLVLDDSAEKRKALKEEIRQEILKEQAEAAAMNAGAGETDEAPEAPKTPQRTRKATKPAESAAE